MMDSDVAGHMTRLKLKLLEKKLENERENLDDFESPFSATRNYDDHGYALRSALRRRKDLLQQLREQNLLEELSVPPGLPRTHRKPQKPQHIYQIPSLFPPLPPPPPPAPPPPIPEQPRIIQQTLPQQPATIIQQIPSHPALITQIPSPQSFSAPRSGSIKEDMVEMMLMQNAQMHQIIMQNMMLKSLPPSYSGQQFTAPVPVRVEKSRPSTVHHHHYTSLGAPAVPSPSGFPMWPLVLQPGPSPQLGGFPSEVHNLPIPANAAHTVPTHGLLGLPSGL
ncbi:uncharacterized protein C21orf58-like [Candoia aspera]|uniref:uncharacterized protein C21orf58-like n=1 Tax=Candoia aspera TaxID=51853 RepID=UPI002FD7E86E